MGKLSKVSLINCLLDMNVCVRHNNGDLSRSVRLFYSGVFNHYDVVICTL